MELASFPYLEISLFRWTLLEIFERPDRKGLPESHQEGLDRRANACRCRFRRNWRSRWVRIDFDFDCTVSNSKTFGI